MGRTAGVRVQAGQKFISTPQLPDGVWGPAIFLFNGYRVYFLWVTAAGA
jgi:hypothetical protein